MPSKLNIFSKSSRSKSGTDAADLARLLHEPRGSIESSTPLNDSLDLAQEKQRAREAMRQKQAEEFLAKQGFTMMARHSGAFKGSI
ncbi:hypothetical protein DHEL01_v209239 [Diaporthe helianthi]|uniref:Uncharacterized protein n=1 Tax=Diaporthe helianthi TaxID=158607 RepID=A0A2P5HQ22_DIAHE|nr:hypothetical protein DHEL01_v209239 [Diaporthe helianthi]